MSIIIGGAQSILSQIPTEIREKHPRLKKPLDSSECANMLTQAVAVLSDSEMTGSHLLFADLIRVILALQLSVAESRFGNEEILEQGSPNNIQVGGVQIPKILLE